MVSELSSKVPNEPTARGTVKAPVKEVGDWTKLDDKSRRDNWTNILKSFKK